MRNDGGVATKISEEEDGWRESLSKRKGIHRLFCKMMGRVRDDPTMMDTVMCSWLSSSQRTCCFWGDEISFAYGKMHPATFYSMVVHDNMSITSSISSISSTSSVSSLSSSSSFKFSETSSLSSSISYISDSSNSDEKPAMHSSPSISTIPQPPNVSMLRSLSSSHLSKINKLKSSFDKKRPSMQLNSRNSFSQPHHNFVINATSTEDGKNGIAINASGSSFFYAPSLSLPTLKNDALRLFFKRHLSNAGSAPNRENKQHGRDIGGSSGSLRASAMSMGNNIRQEYHKIGKISQ